MSTPQWLQAVPPSGSPLPDLAPGLLEAESGSSPRSIVPYSFGFGSLAASQTNLQASRAFAGVSRQIPVTPAYRGSVVAIAIRSTANKTAGEATFTVFIKGVATTATLSWPSATSKAKATFAPGTYGFVVEDDIDVRVTTDGTFAPITLDVEILLHVLHDPSSI